MFMLWFLASSLAMLRVLLLVHSRGVVGFFFGVWFYYLLYFFCDVGVGLFGGFSSAAFFAASCVLYFFWLVDFFGAFCYCDSRYA